MGRFIRKDCIACCLLHCFGLLHGENSEPTRPYNHFLCPGSPLLRKHSEIQDGFGGGSEDGAARAWERPAGCPVPVLRVPELAPGSCAAFLSHVARLGEPLKGVLVSRPLFDSTIFASGDGTFGLTHHPSPVATPAATLHSGSAVLCYEHGLRRWSPKVCNHFLVGVF